MATKSLFCCSVVMRLGKSFVIWALTTKKYMLVRMIAFYIEDNFRMQNLVMCVDCLDGNQMIRR